MIGQTREQEKWEQLTLRERTLLKAMLMVANELGDEAALSRLFVALAPAERDLLRNFRCLQPIEQAGVQALAAGFNNHPAGSSKDSQGSAPGFRDPVGQVSVESREGDATDGHGEKSRR